MTVSNSKIRLFQESLLPGGLFNFTGAGGVSLQGKRRAYEVPCRFADSQMLGDLALVGAYFVDVRIGVVFSSSYGEAAMAVLGWKQ